MGKLEMKVIRPPKGCSVLSGAFAAPIIRGRGDTTYLCGGCKARVLENVGPAEFRGFIVKCWKCGQHNEVPQ